MESLACSAFNARGGIKTLVLPAIAGSACNHLGLTWAVNRTAGAALLWGRVSPPPEVPAWTALKSDGNFRLSRRELPTLRS
jgi:hypothetical protein